MSEEVAPEAVSTEGQPVNAEAVDPHDDTWEQLLSAESESRTAVWLCQYNFPLTQDEDGEPYAEDVDSTLAGETFVSTSKFRAINRLLQVIDATAGRTDIDVADYALDTEEGNQALLRDFFSGPGTNLSLTLVELV